MTKIYIIKAFGGSYDDAWKNNLYAVVEEEQAKVEVQRLTELHKFCEGIWPQVHNSLTDGYAEARIAHDRNYFLQHQDLKLPPEPKEPVKHTKETQAEYKKKYNAWRKEFEPIWKALQAEHERSMQMAYQASHDKAVELGATKEHLEMFGFFDQKGGLNPPSFDESASYCYQELELR